MDLVLAWRGPDDDDRLFWAQYSGLGDPVSDAASWSPQHLLGDRAAIAGPAVAEFGDQLFMAWRGSFQDHDLYFATLRTDVAGASWSEQRHLADRGSLFGPALAVFRGTLYMAWRGAEDDSRLFWATYDIGRDPPWWSEQHPLDDRGTFTEPALAVFGDQLFMAWRGIAADHNLYWSTFDGSTWSDQRRLTDRGSVDGPALVVFQGRLRMFWRGGAGQFEGDARLFVSTYLGGTGDGAWSPQEVVVGPDAQPVPAATRPGVSTLQTTSLDGERCFLVTLGTELVEIFTTPKPVGQTPGADDVPETPDQATPPQRMFLREFDGSTVTATMRLQYTGCLLQPALTHVGPTITIRPHAQPHEFLAGVNADHTIQVFQFTPAGGWITGQIGWASIAGSLTSWVAGGTWHLAGLGTDGNMYVLWQSPGNDWKAANITAATSAPSGLQSPLTSWVVGESEFLAGVNADHTIQVFQFTPAGGWVTGQIGWASIAGSLTSWVAGGTWHLAGLGTDGNMYVLWQSPGNDWKAANITAATSAPSGLQSPLTSWVVGESEFLAGVNADHTIQVFQFTPAGGWTTGQIGWASIAGSLTSWVAGGTWHLAGLGTDGNMYVLWQSPGNDWKAANITAATSAPSGLQSPLTSWVVGDVEHVAGVDASSRPTVYWWSPGNDWQFTPIVATNGQVDASLTSWMSGF